MTFDDRPAPEWDDLDPALRGQIELAMILCAIIGAIVGAMVGLFIGMAL